MAAHPDAEVVHTLWQSVSGPADTGSYAQFWAPDCVLHIAGSHQFSGEHKGRETVAQSYQQYKEETNGTYHVPPEPQQLFVDGHGHVVGVRRWVADRNGRHVDALGASVYTIAGGRLTSVEQCEEDLDKVNEFWGESPEPTALPVRGTHWRADIDPVRRTFDGAAAGNNLVAGDTCTSDVRLHVPGGHRLSGEFQGVDAMRQWVERARRETRGTIRWQVETMFADGRGHVIAIRHVTADRDGRQLDTRAAVACTVLGDRLSDVAVYEEDLDVMEAFWA